MTNPVDKIIESVANAVIEAGKAHNAPTQGESMMTFAQFEEDLDAHFQAYHEGTLSRHKLKAFLKSYGFTSAMIREEIKQQLQVRRFKADVENRNRADASNAKRS